MNKNITIKDIAREAGVSISLVSFVMNNRIGEDGKRKYRVSEQTRQRVLEVAHRLDYQPNSAARSLRKGRSHVIGAILSDLSNIFYGAIARELEECAVQEGFTVLFGSSDENPERFEMLVRSFLDKDVEGFIVVPCEGSEQTMKYLQETAIPMVVIDRHFPWVRVPNVLTDNAKAMDKALKALVRQGASKLAMVSYAMRISSMTDRENRFLSYLQEHGVEAPEQQLYQLGFDSKPEDADRIVQRILESGCDGIVIASNMLAVSVIKALYRRGIKIQQDIHIVSFDYSNVYALFEPAIPYIQQPLPEITRSAAEILFRLIDEKSNGMNIRGEKEKIVFPGILKYK